MSHQLNSNRSDKPHSSFGLGYKINQAEEAHRIAFGVASDLVRECLDLGVRLRAWAIETKAKTHSLLKLGDQLSLQHDDAKLKSEAQNALSEILYWENEIAHSIRNYFSKVSDILSRIKLLNPPLKSTQLDPYVEAILSDRRATLATLEPLSEVIDKIARLKTLCWFETPLTSRRPL